MSTRVLIVYGGRSPEHEISILSARFIVTSLDRTAFEPVLVGIDRSGRWRLQREDQLPTSDDPRQARIGEGPSAWLLPMPESPPRLHVEGRPAEPFDIVFPVLHGPLGEDGAMQGLFELASVPYVGAGVMGSAIGMDKQLQKEVLAQAGIPIVPHVAVRRAQWDRDPERQLAACEALGYPLFVKPANMGSSLGVGKAAGRAELQPAIEVAFGLDTKLVVERGLPRVREIELSVLGNDALEVSVPGEIVVEHPDGFYSYAAKYIDPHGARLHIPAPLSNEQTQAARQLAARAFSCLEGAGMARVDLLLSEDQLYLNEINTIPGFTAISMYPQLWAASGLGARELVTRLLELGFERHRARAALG